MQEGDRRLDLLVPWDLPTDQTLSDPDRALLEPILHQFLQALTQPDPALALPLVESLLVALPPGKTADNQMPSTKTALQESEVKDFDTYFGIAHVQTSEVARCVVRSLLLAYHQSLLLCQQSIAFDPEHIACQQQGFLSHLLLLARVFHIPLEVPDAARRSEFG